MTIGNRPFGNRQLHGVQSSAEDWISLPTITTPRLALRLICDDDVDAMFEVFSDAEVMRYGAPLPLQIARGHWNS